MQARLLEVMRLEREEKMAKKAAETPANLPVQKAYPLLKTQLDKLQELKGHNYQESDAAEDEWIQLTEKLVLRSFGGGSTNYGNILHARAAGEHYMTAGMTTAERLQKMLDESAFALIIMTAEDEHDDGKQHARENVVHEAGCSKVGSASVAQSFFSKRAARNFQISKA
jgi:hypothetical protein